MRTLTLPPPKPAGVAAHARFNVILSVAADGSKVLLNDDTILASDGTKIGALDPTTGLFGALWADDDHLCQLSTSDYVSSRGQAVTGSAWLQKVTLHGAQPPTLSKVADLGTAVSERMGRTHDYALAACSAVTDRAVVLTRDSAGPGSQNVRGRCVTEVRVVQLSTGTQLAALEWPQARIVHANTDGTVLASAPCSLAQPLSTWIERIDGTSATAQVTLPDVIPEGLSGDGSVAIVRDPLSKAQPQTQLFDLRAGRVARSWASHGADLVFGWPGSRDVYLAMPAQGGGFQLHLASPTFDRVAAPRVFTIAGSVAA